MSWREQVRIFSEADCIAGEFRSDMHNAIFSRKGAVVICFNWITDVQSRIANFRSQKVGYILADDNLPRVFPLEGGFVSYSVNPARFRKALIEAGLLKRACQKGGIS
jgi:capsular polysaccharide biosynthesis protein